MPGGFKHLHSHKLQPEYKAQPIPSAGVCFYAFKPEDQQLYVLMVHEARRRQFKKAPQPSNLGSVAPAPTSAILPESNMQTELAQEAAPQSQGAGTAVAAGGTAGNGQQGSSAAEAPVSQEQLALHREQDAAAEASTGRPTLVWNFPGACVGSIETCMGGMILVSYGTTSMISTWEAQHYQYC